MHMPAEQAFWCLVSICDKYLAGYYTPEMVCLSVCGCTAADHKNENQLSWLFGSLLSEIYKISSTDLFYYNC
jgi:hypothetical protein